jgi:hypothetical protein
MSSVFLSYFDWPLNTSVLYAATNLICTISVTQDGALLKNGFRTIEGSFARNLKKKCAQVMRTLFTSYACFPFNLCAVVFSIVQGTK